MKNNDEICIMFYTHYSIHLKHNCWWAMSLWMGRNQPFHSDHSDLVCRNETEEMLLKKAVIVEQMNPLNMMLFRCHAPHSTLQISALTVSNAVTEAGLCVTFYCCQVKAPDTLLNILLASVSATHCVTGGEHVHRLCVMLWVWLALTCCITHGLFL